MCRVLCQRLPAEFVPIYLDNPVGSFDDLLRVACIELGLDMGSHRSGFREELQQRLTDLAQSGKKVVLVIDEAEKLFLAALERLVRMICDAETTESPCVVLAGRNGLEANLEQLSIYCANVDVQDGYILEPMDRVQTGKYLDFCLVMAGLDEEQYQKVFTEGAVDRIYAEGRGNFRLTNILAEEALQISCSEKSFLVLLDHVEPQARMVEPSGWRLPDVLFSFVQNKRVLLVAGIAFASIVLLCMSMLGGRSDEENLTQTSAFPEKRSAPPSYPSSVSTSPSGEGAVLTNDAPPVIIATHEPVKPRKKETNDPGAETVREKPSLSPEAQVSAGQQEGTAADVLPEKEPQRQRAVPLQAPDDSNAQDVVAERLSDEQDIAGQRRDTALSSVDQAGEQAAMQGSRIAVQASMPQDTVSRPEATVEPAVTAQSQVMNGAGALPVIMPDGVKRRITDAVIQPEPGKVVKFQEKKTPEGRDGNMLFMERLRASEGWLGGAYQGKYTIQLMMLTSKQASANIKKMLVQDEYYELLDELFILRKKTSPLTVFVFYGTYDSMDQARQARNTMPVHLRKHHPYVLSIGDAQRKTRN